MTSEQNKFDFDKFAKRVFWTAVAGATIVGTYSAREHDLPPFNSNKVGTSSGICVSLATHISKDAKFYGPVVSLYCINEGEIKGANINLVSASISGKVSGLELTLFNSPYGKKGITYASDCTGLSMAVLNTHNTQSGVNLGIINISEKSYGLDFGVVNAGRESTGFDLGALNAKDSLNGVQLGLFNYCEDNKGFLINYHFDKSEAKK